MKILQVLHKGNFNTGSVHQMFQASIGLKDKGHRVFIMGRSSTELQREAEKNSIPFIGLPFKNELDLKTIKGIISFLKREKPDIIHIHKGLDLTLFYLSSFFFKDLNIIANRGVSFPLNFFNRIKYNSKKVKAIVCVCEFIKDIVIKSGKIKEDKVYVIYAGTDTNIFDPLKENGLKTRKELGFDEKEEIICQIGLREWRGWRTAIEAFYLVKKEYKDAKMLLVAAKDDAHIREIYGYASSFGIKNGLKVLGYRKDNVQISALQDIAIDLSYKGVGITGTLREALSMEKPVVASDVGGNRELVLDGKVGFLVPPRDPKVAAEKILILLKDKDLREKLGKEGRRRVQENFSSQIRISKLEGLYEKILNP